LRFLVIFDSPGEKKNGFSGANRRRGKSGHGGKGSRVTPGCRKATESAAENKPPAKQVRVKRRGKSPPVFPATEKRMVNPSPCNARQQKTPAYSAGRQLEEKEQSFFPEKSF